VAIVSGTSRLAPPLRKGLVELENGDVEIRVDADLSGDLQSAQDDVGGGKIGTSAERPRGRQSKATARADGHDLVVRLDHVAVTGDQQQPLPVRDHQLRLETAQKTVG